MHARESKGILIVGDWVVDEYWFLVRHNSDRSSHTGFVHYRLSSAKGDIVADLCGAGHVARLFSHLSKEEKDPCNVTGLGVWNAADTDFIKHLTHARSVDCASATANYCYKPQKCRHRVHARLITMHPDSPTIRVVRCYHEEDGGLQQINRMDWEPGPQDRMPIEWDTLDEQLPPSLTGIVVDDRQKGAITEDVVRHLRERYPKVAWYVKSNDEHPEWLDLLQGVLQLMVIGPEVASRRSPWGRWLVRDAAGAPALEVVGDHGAYNTAVVSEKHEVVACGGDRCLTGKSEALITPLTELGWSTAFFSALAFNLTLSDRDRGPELWEGDIEFALAQADRHAGVPTQVRFAAPQIAAPETRARSTSWSREKSDWEHANTGLGLIDDNGELRLDVWRGSTQIPGYIACIRKKKHIIDEIGHAVRAFRLNSFRQQKPLCILLNADPGSGKTFLAKSIANALEYAFLKFDISQMVHREEILDAFDMVATQQVNSRDPLLVFVDEINGTVENGRVYGSFLTPLEDGVYLRKGRAHVLQPCIWLFTGTPPKPNDTGDKLSDFESRMTMVRRIDFLSLKGRGKDTQVDTEAQLEQVYVGASMIRKQFPDVQQVSQEVLHRFHSLDPRESPARSIYRQVSQMRNVQYGRITRRNCEAWGGDWPTLAEPERMVHLVFE